MIAERNWYAVYTRPRWEKKVSALLNSKNINTFCPVNRAVHQWSDRKKVVEEPLFRSYVFVQVSKAEMLPVKQTDGVLHFVEWLKKPAVIKDEEIATIKRYLAEYKHVHAECLDINMHDLVRITKGPLVELQGNIVSVGKHKVRVYLESLRYVLVVEVEKHRVEVVKCGARTAQTPLRSSALLR